MTTLIEQIPEAENASDQYSTSSRLAHKSSTVAHTGDSIDSNSVDVDTICNHPQGSPAITTYADLLTELRAACSQLPLDIPVGTSADAFATISGDPTAGVLNAEEAWEERWDKELNRVVGYGATVADVARLIRRGELGLEGFCVWVEALTRSGLDMVRLQPRLQHVLDAVDLL